MHMETKQDRYHGVRLWLGVVLGLILLMVAVGGITRLTESGLSMVTWEPIMGTLPPLTEADWQFRFDQYRAFPEYQQLRRGMTLDEFKVIFFWEYFHRLLGRLLGVAYAFPLAVFWMRKRLSRPLKVKLLVGLALGGGQGLMGWYMVKSGLVDDPFVSHYRLAAHLGLAFVLFAYLLWVFLSLFPFSPPQRAASRSTRVAVWGLAALLVMQIVWGAFVAGLNAGFIYNTYPKMQGYWLAPFWNHLEPLWINAFDNPILVQFIHRTLGVILVLYTLVTWWFVRRDAEASGYARGAMAFMVVGMAVQFGLGVLTLLWMVPLALGVMHQVMACVLVGGLTWLLVAVYGRNDWLHA
ncbi:MAG TPA: COX15/CtaA family protein [Kiritimatiellia bacterium]|nr:COX15/CtaA family protein [Kiritimatiellia bacterium]HMO99280.1 COX15/CtaA family protein [Kiritimatiellia bacterium]